MDALAEWIATRDPNKTAVLLTLLFSIVAAAATPFAVLSWLRQRRQEARELSSKSATWIISRWGPAWEFEHNSPTPLEDIHIAVTIDNKPAKSWLHSLPAGTPWKLPHMKDMGLDRASGMKRATIDISWAYASGARDQLSVTRDVDYDDPSFEQSGGWKAEGR